MNTTRKVLLLSALVLAGNLPAHAKTVNHPITIKPGLWEIQSSSALFGHTIPDISEIINYGPETVQAHTQEMLQKNHVRIRDDGSATVCIKAQQIAKNNFVNDDGSGCTVSKAQRHGNRLHFDIRCAAPPGNGQSDITLLSKTQWSASTNVNVTVRGIEQAISNTATGKWLAATCPHGQ